MALEEFRKRFGKAMMELVGAFVLVLTYQVAVGAAMPGAPLAIGLVLTAAIYAGGPVSGGHYNPAISLAVFIRGALSMQDLLWYWLFQVGGGLLGALVGGIIGGKFVAMNVGVGYHTIQAFLAELVFTGLLCLVVLATITNSKVEGNPYYGAAIGFVIFAGSVAAGKISGGGFNPAVLLGLGIVKHFWKIGYMLWILLAELLGGVLGAFLFYIVDPEEFAHFGEEAHGLVEEARALLPGRGSGNA